MNIGQAICHRVGMKDLKKDPNAVERWLHYQLGNGRPWDGRVIASIINSLLGPAAVGDIERVLTQLALAYAADPDPGLCPEPSTKKRPSRANPRSRGKPAGRRRSRRK